MFRKTFIRLIIVIMMASASLIVFSTSKNRVQASKEVSSDSNEDRKSDKNRGDFTILESLSRTIFSTTNY